MGRGISECVEGLSSDGLKDFFHNSPTGLRDEG